MQVGCDQLNLSRLNSRHFLYLNVFFQAKLKLNKSNFGATATIVNG